MNNNERYCDECINIVGTPLGCYCKITGLNLQSEYSYSLDVKDKDTLLSHCGGKHKGLENENTN